MTLKKLRTLVFRYYKKHGRHTLPWRTMHNPYRILVSEVMLQQTQVERVIPYYKAFLMQFPTVRTLANAPLSDVLRVWQGLGYNRRAKMLHQAAKAIVENYGGKMPKTARELEGLPGVGPYTAKAVAAFAHNEDVILIETNIRTVVTHHLFPNQETVTDAEILEVLTKAYPNGRAREWYAALMDYGSYLKRSGVRINAKKRGYKKQSAFKGSTREVRGAILRALAQGPKRSLTQILGPARSEQVQLQLGALIKEGLVEKKAGFYRLPS